MCAAGGFKVLQGARPGGDLWLDHEVEAPALLQALLSCSSIISWPQGHLTLLAAESPSPVPSG